MLSKLLTATVLLASLVNAGPPGPGETIADISLPSVRGGNLGLKDLLSKGPTVLVVLRGYPGYQCPFCQRQLQDFVQHSRDFSEAKARVVFVYPGPSGDLDKRAMEALKDKSFPPEYEMLLDAGYAFTNLNHIRWNGANETAYPTIFLVNAKGVVTFVQSTMSHGGRTLAADILARLKDR